MHGDGKMILSICKYVPSMAPTNDKHIKVKNGALSGPDPEHSNMGGA